MRFVAHSPSQFFVSFRFCSFASRIASHRIAPHYVLRGVCPRSINQSIKPLLIKLFRSRALLLVYEKELSVFVRFVCLFVCLLIACIILEVVCLRSCPFTRSVRADTVLSVSLYTSSLALCLPVCLCPLPLWFRVSFFRFHSAYPVFVSGSFTPPLSPSLSCLSVFLTTRFVG